MCGIDGSLLIGGLVVCLGVLVVYYCLLVRAILQMLRSETPAVMLWFAFLALIPVPPTVVMGILVLIVWHLHKKTPSPGSP